MKPSVSFAALSFGALASAGFVPADRRSPLASPSFSSLIRHSGRGPPTPAFPTPHNTPSRLFNLTAEGPTCANGPIRQIENGQNRIGGDDGVGTYLLKDGKIFDMSRRGCTLTPPTNQWQCNEGVLPSPGFGISKDGLLTYLDRTTFWACPVNDFCVWNTYSEPIKNQLKCVEIKLRAQERGQSGGKSSELPKERPQTPSQVQSPTTQQSICPRPSSQVRSTSTRQSTSLPPPSKGQSTRQRTSSSTPQRTSTSTSQRTSTSTSQRTSTSTSQRTSTSTPQCTPASTPSTPKPTSTSTPKRASTSTSQPTSTSTPQCTPTSTPQRTSTSTSQRTPTSTSTRSPSYLPQPSPGPDGPVPWGKPAPPPSPIPTSRVGESSAARSQTANPREQPAPVDQPSYTSACPEKSTQTGRSSQAPCVAEQPTPVGQPSSTSACPEKSTQTGRSSEAPCVAEQPATTRSAFACSQSASRGHQVVPATLTHTSGTSAPTPSASRPVQGNNDGKKEKGKGKGKGKAQGCPFMHGSPFSQGGPFSLGKAQSPCPLDLEGKVVYPEPIIPVSEHLPHTALGAHSNGTIAPGVCSLYDFKIDAKQEGKKCTLMFLLPKQGPENERLFTFGHFDLSGRYELKGKGNLYFFWLEDFADEKTTWANKSKASPFEIGPQPIKPGSSIAVHTGDCPAGEKFTVQICGDGNLKLEYEQGTGEDSMGLFIRVC